MKTSVPHADPGSLPHGLEKRCGEPIGNHHLVVLGHYARRVHEFFRFR